MSSSPNGAGGTRNGAQRAQLPLLDRLLDADPKTPDRPEPNAGEALELLHMAVRRDLEALLNARRRRRPLPPLLTELTSSLVNYGAPDPTSGAYAVPALRAGLADEVDAAIRRFEPRLTRVSAVLLGDTDDLGGALRLRVEAVLRADTVLEPVSFETLMEPVTRDVTVREA